MLAIIRKNTIREQLREHKSVRIADLSTLLNVTKETIRRDLREMEEEGALIRTHGGAYIRDGVQNDIDLSTRQVLMTPEKEILAKKVSSIVEPGDYIFLDGSTTAWFIARALIGRKITVLTPSLEIINILSSSDSVKLHAIGGEYHPATGCFLGSGALKNLSNYHMDKAFISCRSLSMEGGLTDTGDDLAAMHRLALDHANKKYLVIDHSKLDATSFSHVAPVSILDGIVMDTGFCDEWKQVLAENRVKIY